jgi:hypothetical protein
MTHQYIASRDFDRFKKGDPIPQELVQDRLIRGRKIELANDSKPVEIVKEFKEELITEVVEVQEKEEILLEDSSAVEVKIEEEIIEIPVKVSKKSKSKK